VVVAITVVTAMTVAGQPVPDKRIPEHGLPRITQLMKDVREDIKREFVRYGGGYLRATREELHFAIPGHIDPWAGEDAPISAAYDVEAFRATFSHIGDSSHWESYIDRAIDRIMIDINKQIMEQRKLTLQETIDLRTEVRSILERSMIEYARKAGLKAVHDPEQAPAYPCVVVLRTKKPYVTVAMMPLTKYRMAVAYGEQLLLFEYAIGRRYQIQAGSYVYFFDRNNRPSPPPAVRIYQDGDVEL
jgi:hypothetical protein